IVPSALGIFVVMVIYGLGFALTFPSMNKIIAESSEMHERGKANGIFYSYFSLGSVAGSTLAGYFTTAFGLPFFGIGFVTLLMLVLMLVVRAKWVETRWGSEHMKKKVLLMGIHGRIGEHLYEELKGTCELYCFSTGTEDVQEDIEFIQKDLFILPEVEDALNDIDTVIFFEDPIMRLNRLTQGKFNDLYLLIADNIARASKFNDVEQIIYIKDELSDGRILSVLGAYGTVVRQTETPIKRYGKNLNYKMKDYNSVRSIQRAPIPTGWSLEDIAWYYFGWLDDIVYNVVNTVIKD